VTQVASCSAPALSCPAQTWFVDVCDFVEFAIKQIAFGYRFAARVKAIGGQCGRQVFTPVAFQEQSNVQFMIEAVAPALVKTLP
jgi:hypothetical protein